jgi:hypothetical protein
LNFLVDAQLSPALARWITDQGHRATQTADDSVIWERARNENAVIIQDPKIICLWRLAIRGSADEKVLRLWSPKTMLPARRGPLEGDLDVTLFLGRRTREKTRVSRNPCIFSRDYYRDNGRGKVARNNKSPEGLPRGF